MSRHVLKRSLFQLFFKVLYSSELTALTCFECHCYGSICCALCVRILHCCCLQSDGWKLQNDFQADSQITIIIVVIAAFVCCHLHLQFTLSLPSSILPLDSLPALPAKLPSHAFPPFLLSPHPDICVAKSVYTSSWLFTEFLTFFLVNTAL